MLSCKEPAPWLKRTLIESVALGSNLKDYDVDATSLQGVKLAREILLHGITTESLELTVDTLDPTAAELALGIDLGEGDKNV